MGLARLDTHVIPINSSDTDYRLGVDLERKVGLICAALTVFLVASVFSGTFHGGVPSVSAASLHDPILIESDSDFTSSNGVISGDGTQADPYVIGNWEIQAPDGTAIEIHSTSSWFVIDSVVIHSSVYGIYLHELMNATITSSVLYGNEYSIYVLWSPGCVILGNQVSATYGGIVAGYADGYLIKGNQATIDDEGSPIAVGFTNNSMVEENTVTGDRGNGIYVIECADTVVRSNVIGESGCLVENSVNCSFWDNELWLSGIGVGGDSGDELGTLDIAANNTANGRPIHYLKNLQNAEFGGVEAGQVIIVNCSGITVSDLTIENVTNSWEPWYCAGIECLWNENLTLDNITLRGNANGALVTNSLNTLFRECSFTNGLGVGLSTEYSSGTNVSGCSFWGQGISLDESSASTIRNSTLTECGIGVYYSDDCLVTGITQSWSTNGVTVDQCDNVTISNCTLDYNGRYFDGEYYYIGCGIDMRSTTNCVIANNGIHDNYRGVETSHCSNLRITGNDVQRSREFGIAVRESSDCVIDHNTVVANVGAGLDLADFSNNIAVTWNYFAGNNWGIYFQLLHYSTVHHNDFVGNLANVYTHVAQPDNSWDDGYPSGGNYWSDYSGADNFSGPNQDIAGSDGFGDEPHEVRGSSGGYYDHYPFMDPLLGPEDTPPVALFTVDPAIGGIGTEFVLDASSSYDAEDPTYELEVRWDIGYDGSWEIDWSKDKVVTWQFTSIGDYLIHMEVRDTHMLLNDTSLVVHVAYVAPVASFVVSPTTGRSSTSFVFDASSSSDLDDGSEALEVRWDWENDGTWDTTWSTSKVATHSFSTDGTYTVALQVRDPGGLDASATRQVVVESIAPTADAGPDQTVEVGASVTLSGSGSIDNVGIANYTWSCEIGGEAKEAFGVSSTWSFAEAGTYEVTLTVRDAAGSTDTDTVTITVETKESGGTTLADYWWVAAIAAIATALIAVLYVMVRRRKGDSVL